MDEIKSLPKLALKLCQIGLLTLLVSCSTTKTSLKQDIDRNLEQDEGYLLIGINSNVDLEHIKLNGETSLKFGKEDLQKGSSYILTTVPSGKYSLKQVGTHRYFYIRLKQENWSFEVKPGRISYIGDLEVQRHNLFYWLIYAEMDNRSSSAIKYLQENFPNILDSRELHYAGPGSDRFINFYNQYTKQTATQPAAPEQAKAQETK